MPPLQPIRPWKPDFANMHRRASNRDLVRQAALERRTEHWRMQQVDSHDTERLHIGEYYHIQIDLAHMNTYYQSIGIDERTPQSMIDLIPKIPIYEEAHLVDKFNSIYKFLVDPAVHSSGIIMVPGYPGILLARQITAEVAIKARKKAMRDQQTREIQADGKKLRTMR